MQLFKNIKWLPVVMLITIIGITVFQVYWLDNTYEREKRTLEIRSNMTFRETVYQLQASKLNLDSLLKEGDTIGRRGPFDNDSGNRVHRMPPQKMIALMNVLHEKRKDSAGRKEVYSLRKHFNDRRRDRGDHEKHNRLIQLLYEVDSLQDSLKLKNIEAEFARRMDRQNFDVPFSITKINKDRDEESSFNEVVIGFSNPLVYRLDLGNTTPYLLKRLAIPILLSVFIVGFTLFSFVLLYKNLLRQKRLSEIKNEFISNITHELKTPIATVSVAIEALQNFNASIDPERSKEYLNISANELQRLSLLVDKVLKLSMFEKKEVDLKYETMDMKQLIEEVTSSMRLQFEKRNAEISITSEGNTMFEGDRLHLVSVIFNLLDNALKYSQDHPKIKIETIGSNTKLYLVISDNGIGIPTEYKEKVFEKFFRVPTGNLHNAKGYGLGLSYVAQVVEKHKGNIRIETPSGGGSKFVITLPKHQA